MHVNVALIKVLLGMDEVAPAKRTTYAVHLGSIGAIDKVISCLDFDVLFKHRLQCVAVVDFGISLKHQGSLGRVSRQPKLISE